MTTNIEPIPERRPASDEGEKSGLALILAVMAVLTLLVVLMI